ncbi:hypothetical protein Sango_2707500 [Sesamum angolense]|uniref:Reverse transcriptase domain-containing protein n=1 Tax=Sesamum angolense TaxID=2727404 RepID=A0AAE2BHT0_9LAMI|nr:hypothetical protein Sango_2707500 [Sesamum angolense]
MTGKTEVNDLPRKGVIRMIVGGPVGGDSQRARKTQERRGPRTQGNNALVITTLLANYEIERVFIDSGSSADILFGEAYNQIQLGDVPLEAVDTFLYGFAEGRGKKRRSEETLEIEDSNKRGKDPIPSSEPDKETFATVQPVEELLAIEVTPGELGKVTKIGSKMTEDVQNQVVNCLLRNKDIFTWTPQDLEGIEPSVIMYHLNLDPSVRPVKQKKMKLRT